MGSEGKEGEDREGNYEEGRLKYINIKNKIIHKFYGLKYKI